ncbi:MAG: hypothetical protein ACRDOL_14120 [Streptosporangiaceae bacterium]
MTDPTAAEAEVKAVRAAEARAPPPSSAPPKLTNDALRPIPQPRRWPPSWSLRRPVPTRPRQPAPPPKTIGIRPSRG